MKSKLTSSETALLPIILYLSLFIFTFYGSFKALPTPVNITTELIFSEGNCMETVKVLASDIGMRVVGTPQETMTVNYLWERLSIYKESTHPSLTFELLRQNSDGSHLFEMMGEPVIKTYSNITNIIVKLSCDSCSPDAVLLNSHFDSTIVSPGASDDSASVGIMLELVRIFAQETNLKKTIVFLFNGAEETLQDASHAFVTQHELAKSVKVVLNLEAMGSRGKEILFQANSPHLVKTYAKVPRPHASSLSNDIFSTGLLLSDTDFRQFLEYGNLIGLDFAIYQNSYQYHTNLDVVENIERGTIQHFGENIFTILKSLTTSYDEWILDNDSFMIYYDYLGWFFVHYTQSYAAILHSLVAAGAIIICSLQAKSMHLYLNDVVSDLISFFTNIMIGLLAVLCFSIALGQINTMSWFSSEWYPLYLFGPVFLQGLLLKPLYKRGPEFEFDKVERRAWIGSCLGMTLLMGITTYTGIASSYVCKIQSIALSLGLLVDLVLEKGLVRRNMSLWAYALAITPFVPFGVSTALSVLYVFTPILGRIGTEAPVDIIIGIVSVLCLIFSQFYLLVPITFRMSRNSQNRFTFCLRLLSALTFVAFCHISAYSASTPKRLYTSFMENTTSGQRGIHLAFADTGSGQQVIDLVSKELEISPVLRNSRQTDRDWATIFPFSHFVDNYYFDMSHEYLTPMVKIAPRLESKSTVNPNGTRTVHLSCHYEHFIWTVISFYGQVESWSLDTSPPDHFHHTIRHVGGDTGSVWNISMVVAGTDPLTIEISGVERDGFRDLIPNSSPGGMKWMWSDRWQSAAVLSRVDQVLPEWTTSLLVSVVVASHVVQ